MSLKGVVEVCASYDRSVVITGAASGIGRALALEWAKRGFKVGILDINMEEAGRTLEMVEAAGGTGETFRCDVTSLEDVQAAADHFFASWGGVGVLVNNAGVLSAGAVGDIPIEEWKRAIDTDLWGVIYGCHVFVPRMKASGAGHIVNIASMAGITPPIEEAPYNVSKAGVICLSETMRMELAPFNVGVSVVCPMGVKTNAMAATSDAGDFITPMWEVAMNNARLPCEEVARRVVNAVEKNKLYIITHTMGKFFWTNKRLMPEGFFKTMTLMSRKGMLRSFMLLLAKRGWL
jgi:NAD(P)-dependent dehydrogenase (short-subunit alcohol dehydrogenase family)